jgi:NADPH:quinone reductase-like Zn-dependent oxidoreductase
MQSASPSIPAVRKISCETPLQSLVEQVEAGTLRIYVGRVFHLDQIADAHRCMEENSAGGKIVVLTS